MHGEHQDAQKLTTSGLPRKSCSDPAVPSKYVNLLGAFSLGGCPLVVCSLSDVRAAGRASTPSVSGLLVYVAADLPVLLQPTAMLATAPRMSAAIFTSANRCEARLAARLRLPLAASDARDGRMSHFRPSHPRLFRRTDASCSRTPCPLGILPPPTG